jgi:broad specificity phosphatase PhoE
LTEVKSLGDKKEITNELAEWEYGLYEGLLTRDIRVGRKNRGLDKDKEWDIWRDGCEGGEYVSRIDIRDFFWFVLADWGLVGHHSKSLPDWIRSLRRFVIFRRRTWTPENQQTSS